MPFIQKMMSEQQVLALQVFRWELIKKTIQKNWKQDHRAFTFIFVIKGMDNINGLERV